MDPQQTNAPQQSYTPLINPPMQPRRLLDFRKIAIAGLVLIALFVATWQLLAGEDFKTLTNNELGYSIEVPAWEQTDSENSVALKEPGKSGGAVVKIEVGQDLAELKSFFGAESDEDIYRAILALVLYTGENDQPSLSDIQIGSTQGKYTSATLEGRLLEYYVLISGNKYYVLSFDTPQSEREAKTKIYQHVVDSFALL